MTNKHKKIWKIISQKIISRKQIWSKSKQALSLWTIKSLATKKKNPNTDKSLYQHVSSLDFPLPWWNPVNKPFRFHII
jgi:hypothetical protein